MGTDPLVMFLKHKDQSLRTETLIKGLIKNGSISFYNSLSLRYFVQGSIPPSKNYRNGSDPAEPKIYSPPLQTLPLMILAVTPFRIAIGGKIRVVPKNLGNSHDDGH